MIFNRYNLDHDGQRPQLFLFKYYLTRQTGSSTCFEFFILFRSSTVVVKSPCRTNFTSFLRLYRAPAAASARSPTSAKIADVVVMRSWGLKGSHGDKNAGFNILIFFTLFYNNLVRLKVIGNDIRCDLIEI